MQRAHKIRLNPTPEQESYFRKARGIARFTYNYGLCIIKNALHEQRKPGSVSAIKTQFNRDKALRLRAVPGVATSGRKLPVDWDVRPIQNRQFQLKQE